MKQFNVPKLTMLLIFALIAGTTMASDGSSNNNNSNLRVLQVETTDGNSIPQNNDAGSSTCDLNCQNGGTCEELIEAEQHKNVMPKRCICPTGYGGVLCDIETDLCFTSGDGEDQYCQNGAPCVLAAASGKARLLNSDADADNRIMCDCTQAYGISAFAGMNCAFPATEYCTETASMSYTAFCTNGGACKGYIMNDADDHPGCDCPKGYEGSKCEYLKGTMKYDVPPTPTAHKVFNVLLGTLFTSSLLLFAELVRRWRVRTLAEREIVRQANFVTAELTLRCMKQLSNDRSKNGVGGHPDQY
jgi:hypothetical protein|mmetsp:Transcript_3636/g.4838  ORF Transcript_3636/g.4838 Transcript_3636/m.4838 type:complete len:302 (+) Transcript_3636:200-1105(+)